VEQLTTNSDAVELEYSMGSSTKIRWGLALLGGFLAEVGIFAAVLPVALVFGQQALVYVVPPACLVMTFLGGMRVGRRVASRAVLHGILVGVVAALLYIALTLGQTLPLAYVVSHFLKVAGGMAGGFVAARQVERNPVNDARRQQAV
jgi:putative membrane protein (TIGR04086 family)